MKAISDLPMPHGHVIGADGGHFTVMSCTDARPLTIVASWGGGWDHVSVSRADRIPNWLEMSQVHRLFFKSNEWAMQLHAPPTDHVDIHPRCLHLWRPHDVVIPTPPPEYV